VLYGRSDVINNQKNDFYNQKGNKKWIDKQEAMIRWQQRNTPGFRTAILSNMKHFDWNLTEAYQKVGKHHRRGLIVWGNKDIVSPYKNAQLIEDMMPHLRLIRMTDCGHNVLYEKGSAVRKIICAFLNVPGGQRGTRTYSQDPPKKSRTSDDGNSAHGSIDIQDEPLLDTGGPKSRSSDAVVDVDAPLQNEPIPIVPATPTPPPESSALTSLTEGSTGHVSSPPVFSPSGDVIITVSDSPVNTTVHTVQSDV